MKHHLMLTMMATSALLLAATQTQAQPSAKCAPHDRVTAHLAENYNEHRHMLGLTADNIVLELFVAPATGTWTMTITHPDGITCLIASGTDADLTVTPSADFDPEA